MGLPGFPCAGIPGRFQREHVKDLVIVEGCFQILEDLDDTGLFGDRMSERHSLPGIV